MKICPLLKETCILTRCVAFTHKKNEKFKSDWHGGKWLKTGIPYCKALKITLEAS